MGLPTAPARLGVFGGTFDPPHLGHLIVATELRHALALDRVLFVPAGRPPHKTTLDVTADHHRLAMLRLAIADDPAFAISPIDLDRGGLSYTVETLAALRDQHGAGTELVFLMGEDSLRDLPTWREPDRIATLAELGVARRPGVAVELEEVYRRVPAARGRVRLVGVPLIGIASSDLRARVARGAPIAYQVPAAVATYIHQAGLYTAV